MLPSDPTEAESLCPLAALARMSRTNSWSSLLFKTNLMAALALLNKQKNNTDG